jgi:hypothetical protein
MSRLRMHTCTALFMSFVKFLGLIYTIKALVRGRAICNTLATLKLSCTSETSRIFGILADVATNMIDANSDELENKNLGFLQLWRRSLECLVRPMIGSAKTMRYRGFLNLACDAELEPQAFQMHLDLSCFDPVIPISRTYLSLGHIRTATSNNRPSSSL